MQETHYRLLLATACAITVVSCMPQNRIAVQAPADAQHYQVTAISETLHDSHGNRCGSAAGSIWASQQKVAGAVEDNLGRHYQLSGDRDDTGLVSAGLAFSNRNIASWTGRLQITGGKGHWDDQYGCRGSWQAIPQ